MIKRILYFFATFFLFFLILLAEFMLHRYGDYDPGEIERVLITLLIVFLGVTLPFVVFFSFSSRDGRQVFSPGRFFTGLLVLLPLLVLTAEFGLRPM